MKRPFFIIGAITLLTAFMPGVIYAQDAPDDYTLYDYMRNVTQVEMNLDPETGSPQVEAIVKRFVSAVYAADGVTPENVDHAVQNNVGLFCEGKKKNPLDCQRLMADVVRLAEREVRTRALGRDLQIIASSYELPVTDTDVDRSNLPIRAQGIVRIWKAGTGTGTIRAQSGVTIRVLPFPQEAYDDLLLLEKSLRDLRRDFGYGEDLSAFRSAGWRYQYGFRFVKGDFAPKFPPPLTEPISGSGSERQYLTLRWKNVEKALEALYGSLPKAFTPSLGKNEVVIFHLTDDPLDPILNFKTKFEKLNLSVWSYIERTNTGILAGDAGVKWKLPIEPVLPGLCADPGIEIASDAVSLPCVPISGGMMPPSPVNGGGLCQQPLSRQGYLCRPVSSAEQAELCKENIKPTTTVQLAACTGKEEPRETTGGPDMCQDIDWVTNRKPFNPSNQCKVQIECATNCGAGNTSVEIVTDPKRADGVIRICIPQKTDIITLQKNTVLLKSLLLRELTRAKDLCSLPPGNQYYQATDSANQKNTDCCRVEFDVYRTQCAAMAAAGLFTQVVTLPNGTTFTLPLVINGREVNTALCEEAFSDYSCRQQGHGRCSANVTFDDSTEELKLLIDGITQKSIEKGLASLDPDVELPTTCSTMLDALRKDPAVAGAIRQVENTGNEICSPLTRTQYENTIGNNLCYLGNCVEESFEQHRLTPGRQPLTIGDPAYPWDACMAPPDAGAITTSATNLPTQIPVYRPALLVQEMDRSLCRASGLPLTSPPALCSFNATSRLLQPINTPIGQALGITSEQVAQEQPMRNLEMLSEAVASRIGSSLYAEALERGSRALTAVTTNAATLLEQIAKVSFTTVMCPLNDGDGSMLYNTAFCAAP